MGYPKDLDEYTDILDRRPATRLREDGLVGELRRLADNIVLSINKCVGDRFEADGDVQECSNAADIRIRDIDNGAVYVVSVMEDEA